MANRLAQAAVKVKRSVIFVDPLWLVLIVLTSLFGCGGGAGVTGGHSSASTASVLTTLSLSPNTASVTVGDTQQFQATAQDQDGNVMPDAIFTFSSSGNAATVDNSGLAISVDHSLIQGTVDYLLQGHVPVVTNNEGLIIENLNAQN